ncbi:MAG: apolipoprotein N-acyltransferase [Phycisphaeraceae bacterium]|nr:apolipoprotein N-acyltransferase [Phycisphaeraceae bacterium]
MDWREFRTGVLGGLAFGIGLVLAFPPVGFWPATILMPLAIVMLVGRGIDRVGSASLGVVVGTLPAWAMQHAWVVNVSELGFPPLVLYSASFSGATTWLLARLVRRMPRLGLGASCGLVWCLVETIRGEILMGGYPWHLVAHPLIDVASLASPGGVIGAYGVSGLVAVLAGAIGDAVIKRRTRAASIAIGATSLAWVGLSVLPAPSPTETIRVAVIQTNSRQDNRTPTTPWEMVELMRTLMQQTREAAAENPAFIVWPESMMPGRSMQASTIQAERDFGVYYKVIPPAAIGEPFALSAWEFADATASLQAELGVPLLVGSERYTNLRIEDSPESGIAYDADETFNSVFLVVGGEVAGVYDKMVLTPFGEVMPGIRYWPWLQARVRALGAYGMPFNLSAGKERTVLVAPRPEGGSLRLVAPICFEATMPNACRRLVYESGHRRADVIVNGTNDGWFNSFAMARGQHLLGARWRSLELATPMARAANTGTSALIDHRGRLVAKGVNNSTKTHDIDGVLSGELPIVEGVSVYAQGGWVAPWAFGAACLMLMYAPAKLGRGSKSEAAPE